MQVTSEINRVIDVLTVYYFECGLLYIGSLTPCDKYGEEESANKSNDNIDKPMHRKFNVKIVIVSCFSENIISGWRGNTVESS